MTKAKYKNAAELEKRCKEYFIKNKNKLVWAPRKFRNFVNITATDLNNWRTREKFRPLYDMFHEYQSHIFAEIEELMLTNKINSLAAMFLLKAYEREYCEGKTPIVQATGIEHIDIKVSNKSSKFEELTKDN